MTITSKVLDPEEDFDDDEFFDEDDYYDADGAYSVNGLYDAGGHIIPERFFEYADEIRDRFRDGN